MRIEWVEIDNFLCFRHLTMPLDRSMQLLAGANNAGKSSFVRLLEAFFTDADGDELAGLLPLNTYYTEGGRRTLSSIKVWFGELTEEEIEGVGNSYRRDRTFWVSVRCSRSGSRTFEASKVGREEARRLYEYVLERHHFVKIPSVRAGGAGDPHELASIERLLETLEAVLVHRTVGPRSAVQRRFDTAAAALDAVVKQVLDESAEAIQDDLPFQDGGVSFALPEPRFALRGLLRAATLQSSDGASVPVSDRGTGFQSALVLGMLRYVAGQEAGGTDNVLFAVEEPEAFLHPQTQRAMTQVLKKIAADAQVVVTTHSPVVVDTFRLSQIARLPLMPEGTTLDWEPPELDDAQEGRLTRYCTAANSELVFANAAILVEGEGDYAVVEELLARVCEGTGGHYAHGITVIEAGGIGRIKRLVELAEHLSVRSFVLVDRDGLRASNDRKLLDILASRAVAPGDATIHELRGAADLPSPTYNAALANQQRLNALLAPFDAYIMASDLEGLLIDCLGVDEIARLLGPGGEKVLGQQFIEHDLADETQARERLGRRLGSKGWEASLQASGKLSPHLPRILLAKGLESGAALPMELARLQSWLGEIAASVHAATV